MIRPADEVTGEQLPSPTSLTRPAMSRKRPFPVIDRTPQRVVARPDAVAPVIRSEPINMVPSQLSPSPAGRGP